MESEDYECNMLNHIMPRYLFKDPHGQTDGAGHHHESQVIYQQHDGLIDWVGRYNLA